MGDTCYKRVRVPEGVRDHEIKNFRDSLAAEFSAGTRKAGAVIEKISPDASYDRVFALKVRGTMNPSQEAVIQQYSL